MDEVLKIDANNKVVAGFVTDDSNEYIRNARIDNTTKGLKVMVVGGNTGGTVTSVGTGTGLTGGPITTTGTISLDSKLAPLDTLGSAGQTIRVNAGGTALEYFTPSSGGSVTSVSVVTANGFAGTVATASTTPAITLTTTVTGILQGNGTTISAATTGNITSTPTTNLVITGGTGAVLGSGTLLTLTGASLIESTSSVLTITGGTNAVLGTGVTIQVKQANTSTSGYLSSTDWNTFNNKGSGTVTAIGVTTANGVSGSSSGGTTPNLTITLGAITPSTVNGNTFTTGTYTLTGTAGKTLTFSNSITLVGTDATTMTFPSTSATIARTDAAQTFTGTQTFAQVITTANAITASSNAATIPVTSRHNIVTNNSAATLTLTLTTAGAVNMQMVVVQILDFSAVAETITWVNTENSTVSVPGTSNGSTTSPLTVGLIYNSATSKWRCIASA